MLIGCSQVRHGTAVRVTGMANILPVIVLLYGTTVVARHQLLMT